MKITSNFLVVSNYNNDIAWVTDYTANYLVYDQSADAEYPKTLDLTKVIKSPHLGHNIRDYATFIIDHYENLPEVTIFATGNVFPRHVFQDHFDRIANSALFNPIEDRRKWKESWPTSFFSSDGGYCEINNSWYLEFHPTKYFNDYNDFSRFCYKDPVIPRYIRFAPGANYSVPKCNILKLPKVFYQNLQTFVSHCETAIPGESHIIERALFTLWTSNFELAETALKPIGDDFKAIPAKPRSLKQKLKGLLS